MSIFEIKTSCSLLGTKRHMKQAYSSYKYCKKVLCSFRRCCKNLLFGNSMHSRIRSYMLVLPLLILLCAAGICHSKAFPDELKPSRGKRVYDHGQDQYYQSFYDRLNNAEQWKKGHYYPEVDGQPIYIPAVDQSSDINERLDDYYKSNSFTRDWMLSTPQPHSYYSENIYYEHPVSSNGMVKNILDETEGGHRGNFHVLPPNKQNHLEYEELNMNYGIKDKMSDDYMPEVVKEANIEKHRSKNPNFGYKDYDYDEPLVHKSVKQEIYEKKNKDKISSIPKTDNEYEPPVVRETIKQKTENDNAKSELDFADDYEQPMLREAIKQKVDKGTVKYDGKSKVEYVDYDEPVIIKTVKEKAEPKPIKTEISSSYGGNIAAQETLIKSKSKLKKQSHVSNYGSNNERTADDIESSLVLKEVYESADKSQEIYDLLEPEPGNYEPKQHPNYPDESKKPPVKTKEKVEIKPKEPVVKTKEKIVTKTEPKEIPEKNKEKVTKIKQKEPPVKTKEKVVTKTKPKEHPVKTKEKVMIKSESKDAPVKTKVKIVIKSESKDPPVKTKEKVVIKSESKDVPVKTKEKVVIKSEQKEYESTQNTIGKNIDKFIDGSLESLDDGSTDFGDSFKDSTDEDFLEQKFGDEQDESFDIDRTESEFDSEKTESSTILNRQDSTFPNIDTVRRLTSLNSNLLSLIFNPNAERLKLKKCLTSNNETGYCTYIQYCEVADIATSLEKILNNACVIDDIFIGVCCPEFPVETVKVHWEQTPTDSEKQIEDEFGHNFEDCGIRSNEASKLQSWPWKAPLVSMSNGKIFCGGVVISEEYVLTAAHCTTKIPRNQILVRLGQYNDSTGDDFAVVEIKRHAQYNPRTLHNDIALLKLGRRILHEAHVGVICLPEDKEQDDDDEHNGEKATLLGWRGMFGTKSKDPEFLKIMSNKECEKKMGMKIPDSLLCTEARNEDERTCNADSGAPLVIEDDGKYEVIGVLSWNRNDCDQRFPSTFSRVSSYVGWIQKHAV